LNPLILIKIDVKSRRLAGGVLEHDLKFGNHF
jgi:hypothetical protein